MDVAGHKPETNHRLKKKMVNCEKHKSQIIVDSNLENICLVNKLEPTVCCLQVIQRLSHITVSSEDDGFKSFRNIGNL